MVLNTTFTITGVTFASGYIYYGLELWCLTPLSQFQVLQTVLVVRMIKFYKDLHITFVNVRFNNISTKPVRSLIVFEKNTGTLRSPSVPLIGKCK